MYCCGICLRMVGICIRLIEGGTACIGARDTRSHLEILSMRPAAIVDSWVQVGSLSDGILLIHRRNVTNTASTIRRMICMCSVERWHTNSGGGPLTLLGFGGSDFHMKARRSLLKHIPGKRFPNVSVQVIACLKPSYSRLPRNPPCPNSSYTTLAYVN